MSSEFVCPVCGYQGLAEPARQQTPQGDSPSYQICRSCGFEFGYDDDALGNTYEQYRQRWIAAGCKWWSRDFAPPVGWNPAEQLKRILGPGC